MFAEPKPDLQLELAHLLLIDVVGYSKLLVNEQIDLVQELNRVVRSTSCFQAAQNQGKLIRVPTGDGMALIFFRSPEEPARCAIEISQGLKLHPEIQVRMGIHSGPINQVTDVSDHVNVAGTGINIAQRVMDCGDAGHILMSRHTSEDLGQYGHWRPYLHDIGEYEVKHGLRIHIVNLCKEGVGNPAMPEKLRPGKRWQKKTTPIVKPVKSSHWPKTMLAAAVVLSLLALVVSSILLVRHGNPSAPATPPAISGKSIAVLPFENLSADQRNAFFADGIQDEILTDLAKIADLKVISRTSVMQYKSHAQRNVREIANALGVAHVLEGSVQRAENRVRVSAQLIDARTDMHLWAEHYDRDVADVFEIQSEIAKTIAQQLQAKLSRGERDAIDKPLTTDLAAFELYVRARALFAETPDTFRSDQKLPQAVRLLNEAVARDPNFLLAWCLLAKVHGNTYWYGYDPSPVRLELARTAVQTALKLQPDSGEAHLALAKYYYQAFRDYPRARSELTIAGKTLPNNSEVFEYAAYVDRREGRWKEATRSFELALELDPRNFDMVQQLADTYKLQRRYADAVAAYDHALTLVPGDPGNLRLLRAHIAVDWRADVKPFQTILAQMLAEDPSLAPDLDGAFSEFALCERTSAAAARFLASYPRGGTPYHGTQCPHAYWAAVIARWQGDPAKARGAFGAARNEVENSLKKEPNSAAAISLLGMIDAGLGRKDEAIGEGRRACELMPVSKDAVDGAAFMVNLAQIYTWTGEKDLAIAQIAAVERLPNALSYGLLKLHPYWDPLRTDPRFEKIVASLAPTD